MNSTSRTNNSSSRSHAGRIHNLHSPPWHVVAVLWLLLLVSPVTVTGTLVVEKSEEEVTYTSMVRRRLTQGENYEEPQKWHPGKEDVRCETYYNRTGAGGGGGGSGGNGNNRELQSGNGNGNQQQFGRPNDQYAPCRDGPPPSSSSSTSSPQRPPPPTQEEIAASTIVLNISVAVPKGYDKGIPSLLTTAVKKYLQEPNVTSAFAELEYYDGSHFELNVWKLDPPSRSKDDDDDEDDDDDDDDDENDESSEESNNNNNNNRQLQQQREDRIKRLGLLALRADKGHYINDIPHSKYAWFQHTVYLIANDGAADTTTSSSSTTNAGSTNLIRDPMLMNWLRYQLPKMVYQDLTFTGPMVGPYYDTNNRNPRDNNHDLQISYLEWTIQHYGIPIAGIAKPGKEVWELPDSADDTPYSSSQDTSSEDNEFDHPIHTTIFTLRQELGMACLIVTLVGTMVLSLVSHHIAKRREQEELWGSNFKSLQAPQEDVEYLHVGWRFNTSNNITNAGDSAAMTTNTTTNTTNTNTTNTNTTNTNVMMMEVF